MNTGDTFTDSQKRSWRVGQSLGRGLWGSSWVVHDDDGRERVLKAALRGDEPGSDTTLPAEVITACDAAAREQAALLREPPLACLPRLDQAFLF